MVIVLASSDVIFIVLASNEVDLGFIVTWYEKSNSSVNLRIYLKIAAKELMSAVISAWHKLLFWKKCM
jgi:hypothetical protein